MTAEDSAKYGAADHKPQNRTEMMGKTAYFSLVTGISLLGFILMIGGFGQVLAGAIQVEHPILLGAIAVLLVLLTNPLRLSLQDRIDQFFLRARPAHRRIRQAFTRELTQATELNAIVGLLQSLVDQVIPTTQRYLFLHDSFLGKYTAYTDGRKFTPTDLRFSPNGAFARFILRRRRAWASGQGAGAESADIEVEQARLALLGAQIYFPLIVGEKLTGWIALCPRKTEYAQADVNLLESACGQAAMAIERSQTVRDLERRVHELNVLIRAAQGISFTMAFDDLLELFYAQICQVLPTRDFHIVLCDPNSQNLKFAFLIEDDDRLRDLENHPIPYGRGLERQVVESRRAIITEDYGQACREKSLLPNMPGVYAWIGVPMNAGAETIGAICIGSRDPTVSYTDEQRELIQALADQATGAIVKARLFDEVEQRASQLATLNQIAIGLTATLDVKLLYKKILESASKLLDCEAGNLLLVDPETGYLVFEAVNGPFAENMLGQRLPPGTGLAGQAVTTGQPIISNDGESHPEQSNHGDQLDPDIQHIMVVPMRLQDRAIGAIELINKSNRAPFAQSDLELLTAFTSQATIAIENARLYTMTDQALADRVEDLSVMQRIDRELNAGLDIERAMRITLQWALSRSQFEAGFAGIVDHESIKIYAHSGYGDELAAASEMEDAQTILLALESTGFIDVIATGQPKCLLSSDLPEGVQSGWLPDAMIRIVVPIRREMSIIGILLLESATGEICSDEMIDFLGRLADHAAIAISNARFYEEIKDANLTKSRFVSFIAHELKNPMSSIRGYAELVAGGMAGPVNEMQSGFLKTVCANVDRMNTIVSDLTDLTKIQVGNLRLDFQAVQIQKIIEDVIRSINHQLEEKEQKISVTYPDELPKVWVDPSRLGQVLTNLVSNASKYTQPGGEITIRLTSTEELKNSPGEGDSVHVSIQDQGIGISEEDQALIFQLYFRTDKAKDMADGTGLGLSISKSLVEMQGGRIWFESRLNKGTTFHFTVPVAEG